MTALGFVASFGIALVVSALLHAGGVMGSPLLLAIMLQATSLGFFVVAARSGWSSACSAGPTAPR